MTSAWAQLEQMLTCAICLDKFKNPRLLPCQHSFCGDACMEGLVDYARRQIKCPECRAEHRIPYQGIASLPSNVTLIRFLELHARITGEEPEPVPTFMEKCSVCGEKVEGVQRCSHCEKKVCPECKEAHIDLLRREINRINGQAKRCLGKMQDFKEVLNRAEERLTVNRTTVRHEIEESCRRLIEDLQTKQKRLIDEVDSFADFEQKTIDKLKVAIVDELQVLESNSQLADSKISTNKYKWTDSELSELKEIYARGMEFSRLFDPEIGDFTRKIRFTLIPEFDSMRKRLCELGELKFSESAASMMASSLQYCNATGTVALELCNSAAAQAAAQAANAGGSTGYGLAHSNSNTNIGAMNAAQSGAGSTGFGGMLELPNALMRSQSDHRLASQFQQRLMKQQQQQEAERQAREASKSNAASRYGRGRNTDMNDYDNDASALRSRYAPPRTSVVTANDHLLRDWPRPSDNDSDGLPFGSSIHFKSAFMRRKEKERQQFGGYGAGSYGAGGAADDDDDLVSEASYSTTTGGRNVRFYDSSMDASGQHANGRASQPKVFDVKEVERAPLSGTPKLEGSAHLHERLHQMGAKAVVDEKRAKEESSKDKDLVESARLAMTKAASERQKLAQRQISEDEIEKQKRQNKQQQTEDRQQQTTPAPTEREVGSNNTASIRDAALTNVRDQPSARSRDREDPISGIGRRRAEAYSPASNISSDMRSSSTSTIVEAEPAAPVAERSTGTAAGTTNESTGSHQQSSATPPSPGTPTTAGPSSATGGRRSLYGQAVNERSKRQLSSAIQDAAAYSRHRSVTADASRDDSPGVGSGQEPQQSAAGSSANEPSNSPGGGTPSRTRRALRSQGRSMSKQSSTEQQLSMDSGSSTPVTSRRRRTLTRADSSQRGSGSGASTPQQTGNNSESNSINNLNGATNPKNYPIGSGGNSDELINDNNNNNNNNNSSQTRRVVSPQTTVANRSSPVVSRKPLASTTTRPYNQTATSTTTDDDDDDNHTSEDLGAKYNTTASRSTSASTPPGASSRYRHSTYRRNADDSDDNDSDNKDDADADEDDMDDGNRSAGRDVGPRGSREFLPQAVNRLLDRSAQIRRDSQEQRSRGNSPPSSGSSSLRSSMNRTQSNSSSGGQSALAQHSYPSSQSATGQSSFYSNAAHRRLAYQRSQTQSSLRDSQQAGASPPASGNNANNDADDTNTTNSNNSIYTTASSHQSSAARRSSNEDNNSNDSATSSSRRYSGHSTDRTLTGSTTSGRPSYRNDSGDSGSTGATSSTTAGGYQSRFLARSRTSAALYNSPTDSDRLNPSTGSNRSKDQSEIGGNNDTTSTGRSYALSSRDRFMQSAMPSASPAAATSTTSSSSSHHLHHHQPTSSASSSHSTNQSSALSSANLGYASNRAGSSSAAPFAAMDNNSRYQTLRYLSNNSPFIELDDEDDQYSAYFPTGFKTHSEYLRNKFGRRTSSNTSTSSLARSRSSHSAFMSGHYNSLPYDDDVSDDDDDYEDAESGNPGISDDEYGPQGTRRRRSSLMSGSFDGSNIKTMSSSYSSKSRMIHKIGSRGSNPGNFTWPRGVATGMGAHGREIVVADSSNHRVQIFDHNGAFLREFGSYGSNFGQFDCLAGVAIDRLNRNYVVSDRYNHRIQIFDMAGNFVRSFGEHGRDVGKFNLPWGVACDMSGSIYVCDKENHRIQVFDSDGKYLYKFGISGSEPGQLQHPHYIATSSGRIVVTDTNNHRVQVFDLNGRLIKIVGKEGSLGGQFKFPRGIALDGQGYIIVGDSGNNRLQIFNPDGIFVKSIGTWGSSDGEFKGIEGVAVDSTNHNILVCDRENHRIQIF